MDFVAADLGASSTRYLSVNGRVNWIPNNVYMVKDMSKNLNNEALDDVIENNLDVSIWKEGESDIFPMRALVGVMSNRFGVSQSTPSLQKLKVDQDINYLSAILSVALSKLKDSSLGEKINLFIALPPAEVLNHKDKFKKNIIGKYVVTFNKIGPNGTTIDFTINNVACYEESRMAMIQFFTDENHPERAQKFIGCNILSIDIGASTTDLAVFKNGKYIDITGRTYKVGGNIARDRVAKKVLETAGVDLSAEEANKCLIEGRISHGNKHKDISDIIDEAKEAVAREIINQMDPYFNSIQTSLTSMNYIIVSGGGSMESSFIDDDGIKRDTSKPMSEYITNALKDICDGIDVIYYGDEPRLANIRGLGMLAMQRKGEIAN